MVLAVKSIGAKKVRKTVFQTIIYVLLILSAVFCIAPFLWMISSSLKINNEVFSFPIQWIPKKPQWSNYIVIWNKIPLAIYFFNTIKLTVIITILKLFTSALAAYAFSKMEFPFRNTLFAIYIATMVVPWQVYMIPQFILVKQLHMTDTHLALILLDAFTPMGVFLMRQFYMSIPMELSEAARIDGLSEFGIFRRIIVPLSKPAIASLTILTVVYAWNDFMGPLIYLSSERNKTIQLGLRMFFSQYEAEYSMIMTASVLSLIPLLIVFISRQKFFIEGIANTGLK